MFNIFKLFKKSEKSKMIAKEKEEARKRKQAKNIPTQIKDDKPYNPFSHH